MRYMLFAWDKYYPGGGQNDFIGIFETKQGCRAALRSIEHDFAQTFDLQTLKWEWLD